MTQPGIVVGGVYHRYNPADWLDAGPYRHDPDSRMAASEGKIARLNFRHAMEQRLLEQQQAEAEARKIVQEAATRRAEDFARQATQRPATIIDGGGSDGRQLVVIDGDDDVEVELPVVGWLPETDGVLDTFRVMVAFRPGGQAAIVAAIGVDT